MTALRLAAFNGQQITEQPKAKKMQDGFLAIPNAVEDALLRSPLTHRQERIYRAILRKTLGYGKECDYIATSQLAELTGIDEAHVRRALAQLVDMGMVQRGNRKAIGTNFTPVITPNSWKYEQAESARLPAQTGRIGTNKQAESAPTIDNSKRQEETPLPPIAADAAQPTAVGKAGKKAMCQAILQAYNAELGDVLPRARDLTDGRMRAIAARVSEFAGSVGPNEKVRFAGQDDAPAFFAAVFRKVRLNPHWMGGSEGGWQASFDWLMKPANFLKVLEYVPAKRGER